MFLNINLSNNQKLATVTRIAQSECKFDKPSFNRHERSVGGAIASTTRKSITFLDGMSSSAIETLNELLPTISLYFLWFLSAFIGFDHKLPPVSGYHPIC